MLFGASKAIAISGEMVLSRTAAMKLAAETIRLSATDLSNHLACNHLTSLDLAVARGERPSPDWRAPDAWILQQRGLQHEKAYLAHLQTQGLALLDLREIESEAEA